MLLTETMFHAKKYIVIYQYFKLYVLNYRLIRIENGKFSHLIDILILSLTCGLKLILNK
jgi:hypothetical protein